MQDKTGRAGSPALCVRLSALLNLLCVPCTDGGVGTTFPQRAFAVSTSYTVCLWILGCLVRLRLQCQFQLSET